MIGRLVQQQNVRFFQQQPGQIYTGFLAAGQAVKFLAPLLRRNAKAVADFVHLYVHVVSAAGLEPVGQGIVLPELGVCGAVCHFAFQQLHLLTYPQNIRIGRAQHILYGIALREPGYLRDQAQLFVGVHVDLAGIVVHLPGEDVEERGLAAAVAAQNGDALPFLNLEGQVFQKIFADDEEFCQIRYLYIYHGFSPLLSLQGFQNQIQLLRGAQKVQGLKHGVGAHALRQAQLF